MATFTGYVKNEGWCSYNLRYYRFLLHEVRNMTDNGRESLLVSLSTDLISENAKLIERIVYYLSVCLSICLSVYLSICLSVCPLYLRSSSSSFFR